MASVGKGLWATPQSPLTLAVATVVVVVGYILMPTGDTVVGAAAGAAAGFCIFKSLWEEEERKDQVAVAVTAIAGGVAGAGAAHLRSMVGAPSLIGSTIVGAIAGAAIVAIARKLLQWVINAIQWLKDHFKSCLEIALFGAIAAMGAVLLKYAKNAIKWVTDQIKRAVDKVKSAVKSIKEAANKLFNTSASMGSGLPAVTAAALGLAALASASGLASIGTAVSGLASGFGGLLVLALVVASGAAIFGSHVSGQSQAKDVVLPIALLLLFVLFCFLVTSGGVLRFCCLLLFLMFFLWFLLRYRSDRN